MAYRGFGRVPLVLGLVLALAACEEGAFPGAGGGGSDAAARPSSRIVERDVEAPEVFQANEPGLWDGRPSLGGVWVAYPGVQNPERVIIVNEANGRSVIGALFRREREIPGPRLQVSSDAAEALGLLAGQPTALRVTALRREEATEAVPMEEEPPPAAAEGAAASPAPEAISAAPIDGGGAAAAPEAAAEGERRGLFARMAERRAAREAARAAAEAETGAPASGEAETSEAAAAPAPAAPAPAAPPPSAPAAAIAQPWIQIGIFSVEANAERAAAQMRAAGLRVVIRRQESQGKVFWRVLVGPAATLAERDQALAKVKGLGYRDAYAVRN